MRARFFQSFPLFVLLILSLSAPLPAQAAAGCCVRGIYEVAGGARDDATKPKRISACYTGGAKMNKTICDKQDSVINVVGGSYTTYGLANLLGIGEQFGFVWYPATDCADWSVNGQQCPDVRSGKSARGLGGTINIKAVKRDPIDFTPQVTIPGTDFVAGKPLAKGIQPDTIAKYIAGLYYFIISSIGILAVVGIMIGGFQYLMAAGSPEKISGAKTSITSAIIGLIIALTSFLLFSTINPDLVDFSKAIGQLKDSDVKSEERSLNYQFGPGACPVEKEGVLALLDTGIFAGNPIEVSGAEAPARVHQDVVARLRSESLVKWLTDNKYTLVINSAYRTQTNQSGLYACYKLRAKSNAGDACPLRCTSCNEAAAPSCDAPHQTGYAIDVCLKGGTATVNEAACDKQSSSYHPQGAAKDLQLEMQKVGFGRYCKEWWHFESFAIPQRSTWCEPGVYKTSGKDESGDVADATSSCISQNGTCWPVVDCGTKGEVPNVSCPNEEKCCKN